MRSAVRARGALHLAPAAEPRPLRCALYTRKSTEHGLDQAFTSLDNQREAGEAYVKSQAHEGWTLLPDRYDDGGFSGGSLERPALQRLLAEVRAGRVDVIVVYKVDRLTRSLADFAKLVELFDAHEVSFVSVTQAFNTTSSMGRLTLNVLLSFAQFEREVTGERIRDKIAASKQKGMWMGGQVPLGYRVESRRLVVDKAEAETVRTIFTRYRALGSLPALQAELRAAGLTSRPRLRSTGEAVGGVAFTNGPLQHLLRNRVYLGEINHRGRSYPGEHAAIIAPELFEAVQARLSANHNGTGGTRSGQAALLMGKLYDDRGHRMTPSHARKKGVRYRYYVSCVLAQGRKTEAGSVPRVPEPEIEAAIVTALREQDRTRRVHLSEAALVADFVTRIEVRPGLLTIVPPAGSKSETISVPWRPERTSSRATIHMPQGSGWGDGGEPARPMRAQPRARLVGGIAQGRAWLAELLSGAVTSTRALAEREGVSERSVRMTLNLAFLAPGLVRAAIEGRLPRHAGLSALTDMPMDWSRQSAETGH